jgi:hypothetical protein
VGWRACRAHSLSDVLHVDMPELPEEPSTTRMPAASASGGSGSAGVAAASLADGSGDVRSPHLPTRRQRGLD